MKKLIIIYIIIFSLLVIPTISPKSSDEFINRLSIKICEDCQGKDINLSQTLKYTSPDGQKISLRSLPWPDYNNNTIRFLLKFLDTENYSSIARTCDNRSITIPGIDGCSILNCDSKRLDIIGDTYYWNHTKIDYLKSDNLNQVNSTYVRAHESQVIPGNNNQINQQNKNILLQLFWSKETIGGLIIAFISTILYEIFRRKRSKRHR